MGRSAVICIAAGLTAALSTWSESASGQGFDAEVRIDQLQPPSAGSPFTRAEGPHDDFDSGVAYAFRLVGDYAFQPLKSRIVNSTVGASEVFLVEHAFLFHLGASMAPAPWLMFEANFPFAVFEDGQPDARVAQQPLAAGSADVGDTRLGVMVRPFESEVLDVSVGTRIWFPTGQPEAYLAGNDDFARWELVPAVAGENDTLLYGCTLGLAPLFFGGRDGDRLAASCAVQLKLTAAVAAGLEPHFALFSHSAELDGSEQTPGLGDADLSVQLEPLATLAIEVGGFRWNLAGGFGLGGAPGAASARAAMMFSYVGTSAPVAVDAPGSNDRDGDGFEDRYDACPEEAGTEERRGCPDVLDEDGDGIVVGDACPREAGARYADARANGCPDRDNDHLADPIDSCPSEPGDEPEGCPKLARLVDGDFVIDPPLLFPHGQAKLTQGVRAALVEVIRTLMANPKMTQVSVAVSTQQAGNQLVDRRAAVILALFNEYRVDSRRFEVVLSEATKPRTIDVHVVR